MLSFVTGFTVGLSLIVAIGAQNIWVLSQSMAGANRLVIALVCISCDVLLMITGVYSAQWLQQWLPSLLPLLTACGVLMLLWLAYSALRRAWQGGSGLFVTASTQLTPWPKTAMTALAITLLNPHVYLDTVVLIGGVGSLQPQPVWFIAGASLASFCWFSSLTALAPQLKLLLSSPRRWQWFDSLVAVLLISIAMQLAVA